MTKKKLIKINPFNQKKKDLKIFETGVEYFEITLSIFALNQNAKKTYTKFR